MQPPGHLTTYLSFELPFAQREDFRAGRLVGEWSSRYPTLFDARDTETALNQPNYHFYEWATAVHLLENHGLHSVHEGYAYKSHPKKRDRVTSIVGAAWPRFVAGLGRYDAFRCPDLFVYRAGTDDWFFCEVKGPGDSLSDSQRTFFDELNAALGRPVCLAAVALDPRKPLPV